MAITLSALSLIIPLAVAPLVAPLVADLVVEATRDLTLPLYVNAGTTVKEATPFVWQIARKRNARAMLA